MSNVFTLEALEEEISQQFAPMTFQAGEEEFVLRNVLRIEQKNRDIVMAKLHELEAAKESAEEGTVDEGQSLEAVQEILKAITADGKGAKLLKVLGNDLLRSMSLLRHWMEATQTGEAQDSSS